MEKKIESAAIKTTAVRIATEADAELLAKLGWETFYDAFANNPMMPADDLKTYLEQAFTAEAVAGEMADPKAVYLIAEVSGAAAGYAKLMTDTSDPQIKTARPVKLKRLYVQQSFVGAEVGPALMERCLQESAARDQDVMWLTVWEHNPRAQAFYRKWGFTECGTIDFLVGKSVMNDLVMRRDLKK